MTREVLVLDDAPSLAAEAARRVVALAQQRVAMAGRFAIVLAGGSTPVILYRRLAALPENEMPWQQTLLFFGDERCVGPEHEWSNFRMVREALLDRAPLPQQNVFRMAGEADPEVAAAKYAGQIQAVLGETVPSFDVVLLGMGDDGHTASLFPAMPALEVTTIPVVATPVPSYVRPSIPRLTLTLPVLNSARQVIFMVTGSSKAPVLVRALSEDTDVALAVPAGQVRGAELVTWLVDRDAASALE
jgi:6-phosphogluconolactonase